MGGKNLNEANLFNRIVQPFFGACLFLCDTQSFYMNHEINELISKTLLIASFKKLNAREIDF